MCAKPIETKDISYEALLQGNKDWVRDTIDKDPGFFDKLSDGQNPPVLWIGCSDSRVPANQITNTKPGDIFVHRNIANVVVHTDMNMLSVLDYSVNVLKVKHVIVCGHYGCGGVKAALGNKQVGIIDNWLRNIRDVYRTHELEMSAIQDPVKRFDRLVELNAIEGASNIMNTSIVQAAWANGQELSVHAWVYSLKTGIIKDMEVTSNCLDDVTPAFKIG
ncbi:carbonic anhydrase [Pedobacter psychrotolerans]|uniref:Carbonic anhydrase 2 n=1 Tax=Pedobacter psychrotolerans TaxID=1843235 RepID=A0A4R2HJI1_9SPHI|nr:carbonate dehydratase [Pedobacter psychrotolerans]TCO28956.1 carbonic anhydrase [Pedobacter psychrotolerans]GGE53079.1 carbonic anhydrase [Pedobacter psychrotolerans]